ncbi:hypothetical protein H5091_19320 [Aliivibrio sp. SR45-2]|nr:hypothetical protein [Aliivibrio sp. SR45-2]
MLLLVFVYFGIIVFIAVLFQWLEKSLVARLSSFNGGWRITFFSLILLEPCYLSLCLLGHCLVLGHHEHFGSLCQLLFLACSY